MLDTSNVEINYKKIKKEKMDFKDLKRHQYLTATNNNDYIKQIRSAQVHFIHNLDAFVNMYVLGKFKGPIYSNHDSWAVNMGRWVELRNLLIEAYRHIGE